MNILNNTNAQETNAEVKLQKNVRHNIVKIFKCSECGLTFDRASQLSYHHRSIHLGERSQVCQICGKGFFRKADLRTHLNVHLGTNFCICEFCGRKFNHISNLIRHCRVHAGVKPYLCSICDRRFTQVSSLVRHKQIIHGIPKESMRQYCSSSLISNKSQVAEHASKENKITDNNVKDRYHKKICMELKCQNTNRETNAQKDKIPSRHNNDTNNTAVTAYLPLETVIYVTSKQFEEDNLAEIENRLSQDYLAGIEEKLQSIDLSTNKIAVSNPPQDIVGNHETQTQSKDNIIYLHQLDRNSFTFLPRDRGPGNADVRGIRNFKEDSANDVGKSLDIEVNLPTYNSGEVSADSEKFLHKQMCKEIANEDRKFDKTSLNDDNQLYIELSELGLLKFDESRYCSNTDLDAVKSQHSANIAADDLTYTSAQNQDNLARDEDNPEGLNNSSNIVLNNEDPMLRLVQTEAGEQFYEFISNLVEKMQDTPSVENAENKAEESSSSAFVHCPNTAPRDSRENTEKNDRTEHQPALEDLTDMNNEFNYTQFDFHRDEKSFTVLCDHEAEHFQRDSRENVSTLQEKNLQAYGPGNLELLENESHVDFDKYVETNFEVFERLNYENCNEKFLEFVEVADIGVESSSQGSKESPMVCLVQNDGDQLLELLQDCQITEQESDFVSANKLDEDCSNVLRDSDKIVDCTEGKPDFFAYVENNAPLEENLSSDRTTADNGNPLYTDLMIDNGISVSNESANDENCVGTSKEPKRLEKSDKPEKSKASPKKYQCSVCKKAFSTAYNYKQHIGIHFTDQQKFHCKECGVSFAWKSTLNKHIASTHNSNWPPKFVCDICPKVYSTLSQVNEHVKRDHLKQRNHVCDYCGKSFFKSFDLKTHSRTHTNERPYACRVCGKRFHHQSHIIRHERTHSGERPYVCVVCQKAFIQPGSLKVHEQKHRQLKMDILNYQIDEDDPIALITL